MPIEIRELHIRVAVSSEASAQPAAPPSGDHAEGAAADKDAMVAECVEQVVQILQSKRER